MTDAEQRLTELVNNRSSHSEGKYGPHVDGVKVADLRYVLSELERVRAQLAMAVEALEEAGRALSDIGALAAGYTNVCDEALASIQGGE